MKEKNINMNEKDDKLKNTEKNNKKDLKDIKKIKEDLKNIIPDIKILNKDNHLKKIADKTEDFSNTIKGGINDIKESFNALNVLKDIGESIGAFFKVLFWLIKFGFYFLGELLNPFNLFNDLFTSFASLPRIIINVVVRIVVSTSKYIVNKVLNPIVNKAFGWDIQISNDEEEDKSVKRTDTKCYKADEGSLPNTVIISTVLLPPLGIFMRFGLQKWLEILIAGALTILYYIPGLIYSFIMIWPKK